jgi:hypothetical protein
MLAPLEGESSDHHPARHCGRNIMGLGQARAPPAISRKPTAGCYRVPDLSRIINAFMPLEKLHPTLDILRKEKPVYFAVNEAYNWGRTNRRRRNQLVVRHGDYDG